MAERCQGIDRRMHDTMPLERKKREYRGNSCLRCHKQKIKCSRETPCRNCALAKRSCTYAVRDKKVTVRESYIKRLEDAAVTSPFRGDRTKGSDSNGTGSDAVTLMVANRLSLSPLVENSTPELFVSKLKQIQNSNGISRTGGRRTVQFASPGSSEPAHGTNDLPTYEYFALNSDTTHAKCTFKLPPHPYAIYLLDQFLTYVGYDWHWFRAKRFRQRLDSMYMGTDPAESKDRTWLCQLLLVFAFGASIDGQPPPFALAPSSHTPVSIETPPTHSVVMPGAEFFEQGLGLLKVPYEETSVEHIETMNLAALCSFTFNRQKTAYIYAGLSARMCNMLQLHKASVSQDLSPCERESRKRVWWSTFCIDRMANTQTGCLPALQIGQVDLDYPSEAGLSAEDLEEFSDADSLTARVKLTIIQSDAASSSCHFGHDDAHDIDTILRPILRRLDAWKAGLPPDLADDLKNGLPDTNSPGQVAPVRALANLHLRHNQCVILLLRPLLLRQVACINSHEEMSASQEDIRQLNNVCFKAARFNLQLLIEIRRRGLLARLGIMEAMHLFSSLMVSCLAMSIDARRPDSFQEEVDDAVISATAKEALHDMAQAGSLAARGHEAMLQEVETLGQSIATISDAGVDLLTEQWDMDEWISQLFEGENMVDMF